MQSLLDDVNELLSKNHGDESRLLHIKETLEKNKILYVSDRKYLTDLCKRHLNQKNPEVKKQVFLKYSQKSESELYSENENVVNENVVNENVVNENVVNENVVNENVVNENVVNENVVNENTIINENTEINLDDRNIQGNNLFCNNCGSKILENTQFCTECGSSLNNSPQTNSSTQSQYPIQGGKPSAAWYLLPIFFSVIGGIISWACIRDRDPHMAKNNLILGILLTVIPIIIGVVLALGMMAIPYSGLDTFR